MAACYWCGNDELRFVYSLNGFSLFACQSCKFARIYPLPDESVLTYRCISSNSLIATGNALNEIEAFLNNPKQAIAILEENRLRPLKYFGDKFDDKRSVILDLGCGGGTFLAALKYLGYHNVFGIEPNAASVALIRRRLDIPVLESNIKYQESLPKADIVTSFDVLEHVPDLREALLQINRMTKIGGGLHIRVPNYASLLSRLLGARWLWTLPPYHLNYFAPEVLAEMVAASGFNIQRIWTSRAGYRLGFLVLQGRKLIKNVVEVESLKTKAYPEWLFTCINFAEQATRALLFPYSLMVGHLGLDDCIHVIARKEVDL